MKSYGIKAIRNVGLFGHQGVGKDVAGRSAAVHVGRN